MKRRRPSDLYQVDFVAALFGGFLLVWLSGIGEAEFPGKGDGKGLVIFELEANAYFLGADGVGEVSRSVVPLDSAHAACAHPNLVLRLIAAGLSTSACASGITLDLGSTPNESTMEGWATRVATNLNSPRQRVVDSIFMPEFEVLFATPAGDKPGRLVGAALSYAGSSLRVVQVGVLPQDTAEGKPNDIRLSEWNRRSFLMMLTDGRPPITDMSTPVDFSYVSGADNVHPVEAGKEYLPTIDRLVVKVTMVVDSRASCYSAEIRNGNSEMPFQPC